jgi:DeoR family glycerol-3-phosphate regulon repressor
MARTFRQPQILDLARRRGHVTVDGLAAHFGVTVQTIRRDLTELAQAGRLDRVHGGAVLPSGVRNIGYEDRRVLNATAKNSIARRCAALIPDGASVFLNIGTTTEAVARALLHHDGLLVVTNNMNVAQILLGNPACEVIVTGGTLRRADNGLIGDLAVHAIEQFKVDHAVIGCSALDLDGDLLDFDVQEVRVSQAMLRQSRRSILVADQSKLRRTAPARIASLAGIERIVTDRPLPDALRDKCAAWKTGIDVAA